MGGGRREGGSEGRGAVDLPLAMTGRGRWGVMAAMGGLSDRRPARRHLEHQEYRGVDADAHTEEADRCAEDPGLRVPRR